jgi:serine/threonine-protein kinase
MPGTEGAALPFFSPDSQWIAFAAHGVLKKLPISGGAPVDICNVSLVQGQTEFTGGDWGPDGQIVFVPNFNAGLWEVPAEGGTPKLLLTTDIENGLVAPLLDRVAATHPQVLPNTRGILFTSSPDKAKTSDDEDIAVLATGEAVPRILIKGGSNAHYLPTGHLIYGHGGTLFAVPFNLNRLKIEGAAVAMVQGLEHGFEDPIYWVSNNGTLVYLSGRPPHFQRLYIFDRKGTGHPITDEAMSPEELAVSPDGQSVVARVSAVNDDLWTFDVNRGTGLRLTFEPGDEIYPQWTPDGRRIAYGTRTGTIYWRPTDGGGQREELSRGQNARYPSSFSPDGKWLAFVEETLTRGRDIWLMPLSGDRKPQPFQVTDADEWSPKFAPNGRWVAYVSNESGTNEIYLRPFGAPGSRKRITSNGGEWPIWSRNGRELFFLRGVALMSVSIDAQGNPSPGERVVIDTKKLGDLQLVGTEANPLYDVLPDGQHFLMSLSRASAVPSQFNVIVNWFDEIKRLAPN